MDFIVCSVKTRVVGTNGEDGVRNGEGTWRVKPV